MPAPRTPKPKARRPRAAASRPVAKKAPPPDPAPRSGVPSMREQVMAFKRDQILNEAGELFYELGYQRTTLDMVAQRLGVTKPFIYYHFKDKAAVLSAISRRGITQGNDVLRQSLQGDGPASERLYAATRAITRTILDSQRHTAIFFREQKNFDAETRAPLEEMHREFDELLSRLLEQGVARGEFRIADVRLCSLAIGGMVNWADTWYRENGRLSVDELCDGMATLVLQMVGAPRSA